MKYLGVKVSVILFSIFLSNVSSAEIAAGDKKTQVELLAPGYGELDFEAPKAGSYKLPAFGFAKDAKVLNVEGEEVSFHDLFEGKYTLLSFIYTSCNDVNGCPLTHLVFNRIKSLAEETPGLAKNLRLLSMSFDPKNDTPAALKALTEEDHSQHEGHAGHGDHEGHDMVKKEEVEWFYLTTASTDILNPILQDYDQTVQNQIEEDGTQSENFSHILRVYLIDPENNIRNIYSVAFLHPDIIINDVKTLLMEDNISLDGETQLFSNEPLDADHVRLGPGDSKKGYNSTDYQTNSISLSARKGKKADLIKLVKEPPLGLPQIPAPEDNPITDDKIELGKKLFFDRRLSLNETISCAMCHIPEQGFSSNEVETSLGFEGRSVRRNAPTIFNSAYLTKLFHDARETTLEHQVWQPLTARNEMAMPSIGKVIEKIRKLPDYEGKFEQAFDGKQADIVTVGQAIATYERVLVSGNSAFDKWYYNKQADAISDQAKRGFELFVGKAACVTCHLINEDFALFMDNQLHSTGLGWNVAMRKEPEKEKMLIAPGIYLDVKKSSKDAVGHAVQGDLGYYEVTQNPADRWRYRTPTLRNIALTAPYMHDGSMGSLEEVVEFYSKGGFENVTQSPLIKQLDLSKKESEELVEFLKTLTGDNVSEIISDAFATPIGDVN
ncbi:MAG: cytochrome c peroxidase [Gammaproteobacteria bacterium]